jgi:hypothetical protein
VARRLSRIRLVPTVGGIRDVVEVDGQDLARGLRGYTLRSQAGSMPVLELQLGMFEGEVDGEARVVLTSGTHETLVKLGWTPPEGPAGASQGADV